MPPRSKRRKAAKRNKGKSTATAHTDAPTNSHGNDGSGRDEDNPISHDEKDSEAREPSSPRSEESSVISEKREASASVGVVNRMETGEENGGPAKLPEKEGVLSAAEPAGEDVTVEFMKKIEGGDQRSSSSEEPRSTQIVTEEADSGGLHPRDLGGDSGVELLQQVETSNHQPAASIDESVAVASASVVEPQEPGTSTLKSLAGTAISVIEPGAAASSTLTGLEDVVSSVVETQSVIVSTRESGSTVEGAPSEKPGEDPDGASRESTDNETGLTPLPVRATFWRSCCGLFELIGSSSR